MVASDIYGFKNDDFVAVKILIEKAISITLNAHESSYHGGEYFRFGELTEEHFQLQRNLDLFDNEPAELDFEEYPLLLYVNRSDRPNELENLISQKAVGGVLLKREVL